MAQQKYYLKGSAREFTFPNGGKKVDFDINFEDIKKLYEEAGLTAKKGFYKLTLQERRAKDQYGNTHSITLNTFVPDPNKGNGGNKKEEEGKDDLPF